MAETYLEFVNKAVQKTLSEDADVDVDGWRSCSCGGEGPGGWGARGLQARLDIGQILVNVNLGLDPGNPGTALPRRSRNHTAKHLKLDGGLQARLDMQSYEETKASVVGEGIYVCKLTPSQVD